MSETVYQVIEGRPLRIVQIVLYVGGAPVVTELTSSPDERARVMTYLRGEPGTGGGGAGVSYSFASALQWTVNHNLGYRPAVEVMNGGGEEIEAEVLHISVNQCRVTFNTPTAGSVRLN